MKDLFILNNSPEVSITAQGNYPVSLELTEASDLSYQLFGTVKNSVGDTPIENAYVAVYTATGAFVAGDYADIDGNYAVSVPVGTDYKAVASMTGFSPSASFVFSITDQSIAQDFTLTAFSDEDRVIYGKIFETGGIIPVASARIDVVDDSGTVVASTESITDGEYSVPDLAMGTFSLIVSKSGYNTERQSVVIDVDNTLVKINVELATRAEPTGSTISGFITETDDTAIANAWVGLYELPDEVLVQTTSTNADGNYCFENVINGDYLIKSKAVEE